CENQMEIMNQYLFQSFQMNDEKQFQIIKSPGYSHNDAFYEATGNYSCIITCNEWVNTALKKMGIKTSIWSPFDFGVLYHLD
nr:DUF2459 domain-containing protein [Flammeovirgaceae bacterium]